MTSTGRLDAKLLYRRLDALLGGLDMSRPQRAVVARFLAQAFEALAEDLRLVAGVLYSEGRDGFSVESEVGTPGAGLPEPLSIEATPLRFALEHGLYIFPDPHAPGTFRHRGTPDAAAAALAVGHRPDRHVLVFFLADGWVREEVDFALNTVRAALGSRLMEERFRGGFRQAAEIQQSLLVDEPPAFAGFYIAARSLAAEEVGGDFFDFYLLEAELLGLAAGDASGHGLPAALLVRDVVTGLRMGIEKDLKMTHVFRKLNRVIHGSRLSSRFVSVFYGELERNGNFVYVNAGHQPPLHFRRDEVYELRTGGTVIGPLPEAEFRRGIAFLDPGDVLLVCTDGILERRGPAGEFFGLDRTKALVQATRDRGARAVLEALFQEATAWGQGREWEDDATAVVVRRCEVAAAP